MLSEEIKEIIREELYILFHDKRDELEMYAVECGLNVNYSPNFFVYCSNVRREAERQYKVSMLIRKILKAFPNRPRLRRILPVIVEGEEKTL